MMNRNVRLALVGLIIIAAVLLYGVGTVAAQGTVITLADGVVVPGGLGFVDLDAVNVDGFQQVSLLGVATPDPRTDVRLDVAFATDPPGSGRTTAQ